MKDRWEAVMRLGFGVESLRRSRSIPSFAVLLVLVAALLPARCLGQASYTAQIRGVVTDQSGALVSNATIIITNDATNISVTAHSDDHGQYILTGLRPAVYTIK